ncbi:MAG TPA: cytochrome P460 family protein [Pyrinomonadaceae bacterium]
MSLSFPKSKWVILTVCLAGALVFFITQFATSGSISATTNRLTVVSPVKEIEGYKNWTKVNAAPQLMPGRVATDCALWLAPGGVVVNGEGNPHREKYFTVYVNEVGREAMLNQKSPKFPVGSVIVKEKLSTRESQTPELLTVMIKQQKGFNPGSGDWEYMVVDGTGTKIEGRGQLQNCQACHLARQKTDYAFRTYLPDDVVNKLK